MMGISSMGVLATGRVGTNPSTVAEIAAAPIAKIGGTRGLNVAKAKVLPQQAPIMYFLAVASRRCDMQEPP